MSRTRRNKAQYNRYRGRLDILSEEYRIVANAVTQGVAHMLESATEEERAAFFEANRELKKTTVYYLPKRTRKHIAKQAKRWWR